MIRRAADHHNVMTAITPKPKPAKEKKVKRVPIEKQRRKLEKQIEAIVKLIIFWRDGQQCVMSKIDGGRCGNGLMWNHFISQKQSGFLRLDLGNVFCGCGNHNLLDFRGDKTLAIWFMRTFGTTAAEAMQSAARDMRGKKRTLEELENLLAHYDDLYQNRYTTDLSISALIRNGYYGEIIKQSA